MAARRSDSLTRSSLRPRMRVAPVGEGGGDGEHRVLVDHRGRALGRDVDAAQRRARTRRSATSSPPRCASSIDLDRWRPSRAASSIRPVRSGLVITPSRSRPIPARSARRPAGRRPRTGRPAPRRRPAAARAGPCRVMRRPCAPCGSTDRRRRNGRACARCGRASASGSITVVSPGALRPASSTADLSCAEATGGGRRSGIGSRAPCSVSGSRPPSAAATRAAPIRVERIEHAPHRPLAQRGVAVEGRGDRTAGDRPHDQAAAGAGIAEVERARPVRRTADADAVDAPGARPGASTLRPERPHGLGGVEHVLALPAGR